MGRKADVTLHIDEELDDARTAEVCEVLKGANGILSARCAEHKRHLYVVEFDPDHIDGKGILSHVTRQGLHGELIGL